jgi:hypothetical protein
MRESTSRNQAKGLNTAPFAGSEKASQHRRRLAALAAAEEGPVAAAQRDVSVRSLGGAVIDLQLAAPRSQNAAASRPALINPTLRRRVASTERLGECLKR